MRCSVHDEVEATTSCSLCSRSLCLGCSKTAVTPAGFLSAPRRTTVCALCYDKLASGLRAARAPQLLVRCIIGGVIGALLAGSACGWMDASWGWSPGPLAIGFVVALFVLMACGDSRGRLMQAASVTATVLAYLLHLYIFFAALVLRRAVEAGTIPSVRLFDYADLRIVAAFPATLPSMLAPLGAVWMLLGLLVAWRIPATPARRN